MALEIDENDTMYHTMYSPLLFPSGLYGSFLIDEN